MSETAAATPETPKAKAIAAGVEVWCQFEELVPTTELKPNPKDCRFAIADCRLIEILCKLQLT